MTYHKAETDTERKPEILTERKPYTLILEVDVTDEDELLDEAYQLLEQRWYNDCYDEANKGVKCPIRKILDSLRHSDGSVNIEACLKVIYEPADFFGVEIIDDVKIQTNSVTEGQGE